MSETITTTHTTVAIVGGGPAGAILGLLLARAGVKVTLLEQYADFDRSFRGDSIHPSTLELMDQLGLVERLLEMPHTVSPGIPSETPEGPFNLVDLSVLKSKYPYFILLAQSRFLKFLTDEAARYPNFTLKMKTGARKLLEENGTIQGVAYQTDTGWVEVRAALTVGADGRHSMVRKLAGIEPEIKLASKTDTIWFRIPRLPSDMPRSTNIVGTNGVQLAMLQREENWQVALNITKGSYATIKAGGLEAFKTMLIETAPRFKERFMAIEDFKHFSVLNVEINRLEHWHRPGLLFIGDSAHTMSPAFGVGINFAIQDAVVAANVLTEKLLEVQRGHAALRESDLETVRQKRHRLVAIMQRIQSLMPSPEPKPGQPAFPPLMRWLFGQYFFKYPLARLVGLGWKSLRWRLAHLEQASTRGF